MPAKSVFVVTSGDYEEYTINGVFSTKEKAEEYVDTFPQGSVQEWELDPPRRHLDGAWQATILDGNLETWWSTSSTPSKPSTVSEGYVVAYALTEAGAIRKAKRLWKSQNQ
jgi:hypothetical protein